MRGLACLAAACLAVVGRAADPPTCAGPAFGTIYRVTLARGIPGRPTGEVHAEVEAVIARIDRAASTWRADSDAGRFNRAAAGAWVEVAEDLVVILETARRVHEASAGAFDVTVTAEGEPAPGMVTIETRRAPPAVRKNSAGVALDLGGIGPGHAVDAIGQRLVELGSTFLAQARGQARQGEQLAGVRGIDEVARPDLVHTGAGLAQPHACEQAALPPG